MTTYRKAFILAVALCATAGIGGAQETPGPGGILPTPE